MLDMDDHFSLWQPPADLIDVTRLQGMPRHGIGRGLKVAKEQIIALLTALELFVNGAYDRELADMRRYLERIAAGLESLPVECRLNVPADAQRPPILEIQLRLALGQSALEVCRRLRSGMPPIYVGHGLLDEGKLVIHPLHLNESRTADLLRRLREELAP